MDLANFIVLADDPIAKVIDKMDLNLRSIVFVVGKKRNLVGAISGGDLRRYIKNKKRLSGLAKDAMNSSPLKMPSHVAPPVILELMKRNCISTIPLVDEFNRLVQIAKMEDLNATIAWAMGMDINKTIYSPSGRPFKIANGGGVIRDILA